MSVPGASEIFGATMIGNQIFQGNLARQQAENANKYREQQNEMALQSMRDQFSRISEAEADARDRAISQSIENQTEYAKRRSRINLMSAVSGTSGLSVDSMISDLKRQKGRNMNNILRNQEIELSNFRAQSEQARTGAQSRIDNRKIRKPSWGEIGLGVATEGLKMYASGGMSGPPGGAPAGTSSSFGSLQSGVNYPASNQLTGGV